MEKPVQQPTECHTGNGEFSVSELRLTCMGPAVQSSNTFGSCRPKLSWCYGTGWENAASANGSKGPPPSAPQRSTTVLFHCFLWRRLMFPDRIHRRIRSDVFSGTLIKKRYCAVKVGTPEPLHPTVSFASSNCRARLSSSQILLQSWRDKWHTITYRSITRISTHAVTAQEKERKMSCSIHRWLWVASGELTHYYVARWQDRTDRTIHLLIVLPRY